MKTRDELIAWLRDAYAMERGLEVALKKQSGNEASEPSLRMQLALHLAETSSHADAIRECLKDLGTDTSALKTALAQGMTAAQGLATAFAGDERVKDILTAYASEHFEIACYQALRAGAELLGETSVVELCDSILIDEQNMADWLGEHLPMVVTSYLQEKAMAAA